MEVWGTENDQINYQRFEWVLLPCNYLHRELGVTDDFIADECIADRDKQIEYLGNIRIMNLVVEQVFN